MKIPVFLILERYVTSTRGISVDGQITGTGRDLIKIRTIRVEEVGQVRWKYRKVWRSIVLRWVLLSLGWSWKTIGEWRKCKVVRISGSLIYTLVILVTIDCPCRITRQFCICTMQKNSPVVHSDLLRAVVFNRPFYWFYATLFRPMISIKDSD